LPNQVALSYRFPMLAPGHPAYRKHHQASRFAATLLPSPQQPPVRRCGAPRRAWALAIVATTLRKKN
jgi:hypothetical protein